MPEIHISVYDYKQKGGQAKGPAEWPAESWGMRWNGGKSERKRFNHRATGLSSMTSHEVTRVSSSVHLY
jgi:hypothetical protein